MVRHSGYRDKGFSLKETQTSKPIKQSSVLATDRGMDRVREGWAGCRHSIQDKWTMHCAKFSVAGAQGTHGGGRTARARAETGRKALCPSYLSGDSRVS